jgi:peroxiredoxin family protein/rhodanese-related sulfurtransferase/TusA-related sulfurtransferase
MVGFIAENVLDGLSDTITWEEAAIKKAAGAFILDVRTPEEFSLGTIEGAYNIPNTELRNRLKEVPKDKEIIVTCAMGLRGYLAERTLRQNAFTKVYNLTGGFKTWEVAIREREILENRGKEPIVVTGTPKVLNEDGSFRKPTKGKLFEVDACGLQCPGPIIRLKKEMDKLEQGDRLSIKTSDPGFAADVQSWCTLTGNDLVSLVSKEGDIVAVIGKGNPEICSMPDSASESKPAICDPDNGATFIVFSNDLDKALASFVLANGAAATGKTVTMFYTFWGLSVLRKKNAPKVKKDVVGKMFGAMLPKGFDDLALSSMNFGGMGASMMKGRMKKKNVDQVQQMFEQAKDMGVRMIACQMSMDIMGITKEELLDGVEIGGVATYMGAASHSKVNLFV